MRRKTHISTIPLQEIKKLSKFIDDEIAKMKKKGIFIYEPKIKTSERDIKIAQLIKKIKSD